MQPCAAMISILHLHVEFRVHIAHTVHNIALDGSKGMFIILVQLWTAGMGEYPAYANVTWLREDVMKPTSIRRDGVWKEEWMLKWTI